MIDVLFANNNQEQPSCYLDLDDADCLYARYEEGILVLLYYWQKNECTKNDEDYCVMVFNCN